MQTLCLPKTQAPLPRGALLGAREGWHAGCSSLGREDARQGTGQSAGRTGAPPPESAPPEDVMVARRFTVGEWVKAQQLAAVTRRIVRAVGDVNSFVTREDAEARERLERALGLSYDVDGDRFVPAPAWAPDPTRITRD